MTSILVTGGAGYIGSHTCKALRHAGFDPVTYDNLSRGNPEAVQWGALEIGGLADGVHLRANAGPLPVGRPGSFCGARLCRHDAAWWSFGAASQSFVRVRSGFINESGDGLSQRPSA